MSSNNIVVADTTPLSYFLHGGIFDFLRPMLGGRPCSHARWERDRPTPTTGPRWDPAGWPGPSGRRPWDLSVPE